MAGRGLLSAAVIISVLFSCSSPDKKPEEPKRPASAVLVKPKPPALTTDQRAELRFSPEIVSQVESAAGAEAEPFYETVLVRSENLKGEKGFERSRLAGFSVRTTKADEVIRDLSPSYRKRGFLIFRSRQNYGNVPDVVTVVKGGSSYDILKIQKTEAPNYHLDTKSIIAWLKTRQKEASFVITGASAERVEARFIKPPKNYLAFARKVSAFSPDVIERSGGSLDKLAEHMKRTNGFYLVWE